MTDQYPDKISSFFLNIYKLISILNKKTQKRLTRIMLLIFASSIFELLSLLSILPLFSILLRPELIDNSNILQFLFNFFSFEKKETFVFFSGIFVFFIFIFSILLKAYVVVTQVRFSQLIEKEITVGFTKLFASNGYIWMLDNSVPNLVKAVLSEVAITVGGFAVPALNFISSMTVLVLIAILLISVDPGIFSLVIIVAGTFYFSVVLFANSVIKVRGELRLAANKGRFDAFTELLSNFLLVKLTRTEAVFLRKFEFAASEYCRSQSDVQGVSQLPRFILEAFVVGGAILLALAELGRQDQILVALPTIVTFAFASLRLFPAVQQVFHCWTQMKFTYPSLVELTHRWHTASLNQESIDFQASRYDVSFSSNICLRNVSYRFPGVDRNSLNRISLSIRKGERIGIVGESGAGKSTLLNVICCLFFPTSGEILIDGERVGREKLRDYRGLFGYVPQDVFLTNGTLAENIAFGNHGDDIDLEQVIRVADIAGLSSIIQSELPQGVNTPLGDEGIGLSGGQRQRVGIARALYRGPEILIFDEATSALDLRTEAAIMDALLHSYFSDKTILIVSHRKRPLDGCDRVIIIHNGETNEE